MPFLIIFGALLLCNALTAKYLFKLKMTPDLDSCNVKQELKDVKTNKITFYCYLIGGSLMLSVGLLGTFCF